MKWIFQVDDDASTMEKIVDYAVPVFVAVLLLIMNISGWGLLHNCYSQSCAHAGFLWHLVATGLFGYGVYFFWRGATDRSTLKMDDGVRTIISFVLFALAFGAYSGFSWWFNVCQ
jgi:hypothetical protein